MDIVLVIFLSLLGLFCLAITCNLVLLKKVHQRALDFIDAVYVYNIAMIYGLIDTDPLLGEDFDTEDILYPDIYRFPRFPRIKFYTDEEKYNRIMHYYEMFKGIDFDVYKLELEADVNTAKRRMESSREEFSELIKKLIAKKNSNVSHLN